MSFRTWTTHDGYTDTYYERAKKSEQPKTAEVLETPDTKEIGRLHLPNGEEKIYRKKLGY